MFSAIALGQINTATVTGLVTDSSGAAIARAHLEIHSLDTGVVRSKETNEAGQFVFDFLPVGSYDLSIKAPNFQQLDFKALSVAAGQVLRLDASLKVGAMQDTVDVTGTQPVVPLSSSHQLRSIMEVEVRELPQQKLDWTGVANLTTGITVVPVTQTLNGAGTIGFNGLSPDTFIPAVE